MNGWEWVITGYTVALGVLACYVGFLRRAEARLRKAFAAEGAEDEA